MAELKTFNIVLSEENEFNGVVHYKRPCYDKYEVDAYIDELEKCHIQRLQALEKYWINNCQSHEQMAISYTVNHCKKIINHNKYKRCLAMAGWCRSRACFYDTMREEWPYWSAKSDRAYKWYKLWFKIAEQFKER